MTGEAPQGDVAPVRVGYTMSRFPKLTETFVLFEILAVERAGATVELLPLLREHEPTMHAEARPLVERATYLPFVSRDILAAQGRAIRRSPRRYVATLGAIIRATAGSPNFLMGGLAIFPKAVRMGELLRERGVTHLHCHFANHPAVAGFVVHRLAGIPFSFSAHGSDLHVDRHMLREKVAEAAFVVTISAFNRDVIIAACGPELAKKVHVVHCGVDTREFSPRQQAAAAATSERPLEIVCIGTLHEVKGQVHLVEACRLLAERGIPFRCRFIGDGPDASALRARIAEAGLQDRVELAGWRTRGEIVELLATADVLVAPSVPTRQGKREGIPVVLIEAMASGVAVVASRLSGIPELVEDGVGGLLVEPGAADEIAEALGRLAVDPDLRARLGAGGRAAVERGFDLDTAARTLVDLFRAAATEHAA